MMTKFSRTLRTAGTAALLGLLVHAAEAAPLKEAVPLNAASEVPPNDSAGKGTANLTYDPTSKELDWSITYSDLTGPATAAHFHGPAAPGANAGVVVPIGAPLTSPISGSKTLTDAQAADFMAGKWYVNVHTAKNPGGEIRGMIAAPK